MALSSDELILLKNMLEVDEGVKLFPYMDCCGKPWRACRCDEKGDLTIGCGRNLDRYGIDLSECDLMLTNNMNNSTNDIERLWGSWFNKMNQARRVALVSMCFNIGITGLKEFKNMLNALEMKDYLGASGHMLNSRWASQIGKRAVRLAEMIRTGKF